MLRDLLSGRTALLVLLAVSTACQSSKETSPGREKAAHSPAKPPKEAASRPVYRHSVLPGGVQSGDEVKERLAQDSVAERHYQGIDPVRLKPAHLKQDRRAYVSYRVGEKIYWTRRPQLLKAGELVLTDGQQTVRARCGNRLEDEPQEEVQSADESPADEEFEQIAELDGSWPPTPIPGGRPGRQLASLMEPLFGWDPGGAPPPAGASPGQPGSSSGPAPGTGGGSPFSPLSPGGLGMGSPFRDPGGPTSSDPPGPPPEGRSPFEPTPPPGPGPMPGPPRPPILPPTEPPPPEDDPLPPEFPDPEPEGPGPGPSPKPPVYGPPVPPPPTSPPRESPPGTPPTPGKPTPKGPPPGPEDPPPGPVPPPSPKPPRTPDRRVPPDFPTPEPPQDIPEPASLLLTVAGAGALLLLRRRAR